MGEMTGTNLRRCIIWYFHGEENTLSFVEGFYSGIEDALNNFKEAIGELNQIYSFYIAPEGTDF